MNGYHALVVDDSAVHLTLLEHTLLREFDTVHTARNGREAMDIFERERPAVVITDCLMPEVGGFATHRHLRRTRSLTSPTRRNTLLYYRSRPCH